MTLLPPNVRVHLALSYIDMRKGIDGLAMLVQGELRQDPFSGHLFVFRGRSRANLIKIVYWDGTGFCLFTNYCIFSNNYVRIDFPKAFDTIKHDVLYWLPGAVVTTLALSTELCSNGHG